MKILVTGGAGFLGARLLATAHGEHELHTLTHRRPVPFGESHPAPLTDADAVRAAVTRVAPDAIIHLAAAGVRPGERDFGHMLAVNVGGLQSLLDAAAGLPTPPHVVMAGSWFEYAPSERMRPLREDNPLSAAMAYSAAKIAAGTVAEHYARAGLPVTILRVFSLYGPGEPLPRLTPTIIDQTLQGEAVDLTGCEQVRDYVYVDEAAAGFLRAAASVPTPGSLRVLNLGTGAGIRLLDLVGAMGEALRGRGYQPRFNIGVKPYRETEAMHAVADVTRLRDTLGWTPGDMPLAEGAALAVAAQLEGR